MRTAMILVSLIIAQMSWGAGTSAQTASAAKERRLVLIPTALQELQELRVNTGEKAVLSDGTMNAVYVTKVPSTGNTYLNFHVDVDSDTGSVVLQAKDIRLEGAATAPAPHGGTVAKGKAVSTVPGTVGYSPFDWFIDTGSAELRGESLTIKNKAIVQFTIEVPRAGFDHLTLFVQSQRIGTVKEIRERIARVGGTK
jgi:hypothetical protein